MTEVQGEVIDFETRSSEESHAIPNLIGDERRIKQIFMNLVRNSIKFTA